MMVMPNPFWDKYIILQVGDVQTVYLASDFILVFMFLRLYFAISTMFNYSEYMDSFAKKICLSHGFNSDILFTVKSRLIDNPE